MRLAVFEAVCQDPQRPSLGLRSCLIRALTIYQDTRKLRNVGYPAPVFLLLKFDFEVHLYLILLQPFERADSAL